ncbi:MAG TPA: rubrerythrin family protein [Saprospiraceae bacterium]|nr:rubrerythrin family protein [Saprospiraceae bacterium]HPN68787.1 rubrerythrin family protein [Saprospiraceae bacterium]
MKKLLMIPIMVFTLGGFWLTSCQNANTDAAMKAPVQSNEGIAAQNTSQESNGVEGMENEEVEIEKTSITEPAISAANKSATSKTTDNMQNAFKGETNASAKYAAYSKKAEREGYHQIALLFKAASTSENIHANNHKAVLQESGLTVPVIKPAFTVNTTEVNLQDAIGGESYEITTMYPDFITVANTAGNQLAMISLNYAYKTEKKHKVFYEAALMALQNNDVKSKPTVFLYVLLVVILMKQKGRHVAEFP